jgi:iron only hydrogenase large subunit-like protein
MVTDELRIKRAAALYADDAGKEIRLAHQNPYIKRLYEEFLGKPLSETSEKLLHTDYQARPVYRR